MVRVLIWCGLLGVWIIVLEIKYRLVVLGVGGVVLLKILLLFGICWMDWLGISGLKCLFLLIWIELVGNVVSFGIGVGVFIGFCGLIRG